MPETDPNVTDPTPYDPTADGETVEKVTAHLKGSDDAERNRVLELEAAGQARSGILSNSDLWPSQEFLDDLELSQVGGPLAELPDATKTLPDGADPQALPTGTKADLADTYGKPDADGYFPGFPVQVYPPVADSPE